jgi:endonuclease/exonuclease/phosphatase family metal-dependent hydrolase
LTKDTLNLWGRKLWGRSLWGRNSWGWVGGVLRFGVGCALLPGLAMGDQAAPLRIATWNLNNLHSETGEPLRPGAPARSRADFTLLADYARRLDADVVGLQEVSGPDAIHRVFPRTHYEAYLSGRYDADRKRNRASDRIYTAFAVRRDTVSVIGVRDVPELGLEDRSGHRTRHGLELVVEWRDQPLHLLVVHLKSGCFTASLQPARSDSCRILAGQIPVLEAWIDQRARRKHPFAVLGDLNRALDVHGRRDHLWRDIDDRDPPGLKLWRVPFKQRARCWSDSDRYHADPIDFMVFGDRAWQWVVPGSYRQIDYDAADRDVRRGTPSDHCPASIDLSYVDLNYVDLTYVGLSYRG